MSHAMHTELLNSNLWRSDMWIDKKWVIKLLLSKYAIPGMVHVVNVSWWMEVWDPLKQTVKEENNARVPSA